MTDKDIAKLRIALLQERSCLIPKFCQKYNRTSFSGGTRMRPFKIFVLNQSKVDSIRHKPVPTTPAEALPEGVGAEGSGYKEVSTKFGRLLENVGNLKGSSNCSSCFKVRLLSIIQTETCLTRFPSIKSSYASPVKEEVLLSAVHQMVQTRAVVPVQQKNGFYSCFKMEKLFY